MTNQPVYLSPKVSVIIPVYNGEKHLATCLESASMQTLQSIEILCIDDGSTDNSPDIIRSFASNDSRMLYIYQENAGSGAARNNGLKRARGDYISFLDADDRYPSNEVLEILATRAEQSGMQIAGGGVALRTGETITPGNSRGNEWHFPTDGVMKYADYQFDYGYQRFLFSRQLLADNNIKFPDYLRYQDPPFLVKAMSIAKEFYGVSIDTYDYRVSHKQVSWDDRKVCDLVKGIRDCFNIAVDSNLDKLQSRIFHRLNSEYRKEIEKALRSGNKELLEILIFLNCDIFRHSNNPQLDDGYKLLKPLASLISDYEITTPANKKRFLTRLFG